MELARRFRNGLVAVAAGAFAIAMFNVLTMQSFEVSQTAALLLCLAGVMVALWHRERQKPLAFITSNWTPRNGALADSLPFEKPDRNAPMMCFPRGRRVKTTLLKSLPDRKHE